LPRHTGRTFRGGCAVNRKGSMMEEDFSRRLESVRLVQVATVCSTLRSFLLPFAEHFKEKGWRVDGIANGIGKCDRCQEAYATKSEITWSRNPLAPSNFVRAARRLRSLVAEGGYDIVHVHTPVAAFVTRWALRKLRRQRRVTVIYTAHGFHFHNQGSRINNLACRLLEKVAGRWTDYLVVINEEDREAALRHKIVPPERLMLMPGIGVDTDTLSPERVSPETVQMLRSELGVTSDGVLFLMIAEFTPNKRHEDVLYALSRTKDLPVQVAFAGEGSTLEAMKLLAEELGVSDKVLFLGFRRDIPALIKAARATLIVSLREGLPRSTMESLSLEVPAIGTDIRGVRDLLSDGCGILVPPMDPAALAGALRCYALDRKVAAEAGRRGREKMVGEYRVDNIIRLHEDLYARALSTRSADTGPVRGNQSPALAKN
jgi:glycosyltransferase involved in cell wall biosynthesis